MAEGKEEVGIDVDLNLVVELLKRKFAQVTADLEHQNAMYQVALEAEVAKRTEAEEENRTLRSQMHPAGLNVVPARE